MKINEPAADLGLTAAIASAMQGIEVEDGTILIGEVGLGGEVRHVQGLSRRVAEAKNLGFRRCILPKGVKENLSQDGLQLVPVRTLQEALQFIFEGNLSKR